MKIQPYNKNSKHKEAKETFAKQALHNLYEQENEEENRKKRNTGCERINKIRKGYSFIIRKLMAWKERIDLEEEKARKEMERVEKEKAELEEKRLRIMDKWRYKIVQIEEDEDRGYNQRGGRGGFRPRGRGGYRGGRNQ